MSINESDILNWIEACKQQDRVAQEKLYKHFYPLLMPVCMSYVSKNDDAVDIYNQAFLKVFNSLKQYANKGAIGGLVMMVIAVVWFVAGFMGGVITITLAPASSLPS